MLIKYTYFERVGARRKQTGPNGLFLILSRYIIYSEDEAVMSERLCIVLKYIKQMVLEIQVEMDKTTIVVGDYNTLSFSP